MNVGNGRRDLPSQNYGNTMLKLQPPMNPCAPSARLNAECLHWVVPAVAQEKGGCSAARDVMLCKDADSKPWASKCAMRFTPLRCCPAGRSRGRWLAFSHPWATATRCLSLITLPHAAVTRP